VRTAASSGTEVPRSRRERARSDGFRARCAARRPSAPCCDERSESREIAPDRSKMVEHCRPTFSLPSPAGIRVVKDRGCHPMTAMRLIGESWWRCLAIRRAAECRTLPSTLSRARSITAICRKRMRTGRHTRTTSQTIRTTSGVSYIPMANTTGRAPRATASSLPKIQQRFKYATAFCSCHRSKSMVVTGSSFKHRRECVSLNFAVLLQTCVNKCLQPRHNDVSASCLT
jgi:hypothetical protein